MSERLNSDRNISADQRNNKHTSPKRRALGLMAVASVAFVANAGVNTLKHNDKKDKSPHIMGLKETLSRAYIKDSIKISSAEIAGKKFNLQGESSPYLKRQAIKIHIDSQADPKIANTNKTARYTANESPLKEEIISPDNKTLPGSVNWVKDAKQGDAVMNVLLDPYKGDKTLTQKYRIFMTAHGLGVDSNDKPKDTEYYAGTVNVSGSDGELTHVALENEESVPEIKIMETPSYSSTEN